MHTVSVVIPTYNRIQLLLVAVSSVVIQSYPAKEIIIVDDCSTDGTSAIIGNMARTLQNTKIILISLTTHSGKPGYLRNYGVSKSNGEYIAFLDDDDQWTKDKLATQIALHSHHADCVMSYTEEYWMRRGTLLPHAIQHHKDASVLFAAALKKCTIGPSTVMIKRKYMDIRTNVNHGFNPELEIAEDYHLWIKILDRHPVRHISRALTVKCAHGQEQLSHKYKYIERFRIRALELLLAQNQLTPAHHILAAHAYAEKCAIWAQGAARRGRLAEAREYTQRAQKYLACLFPRTSQ